MKRDKKYLLGFILLICFFSFSQNVNAVKYDYNLPNEEDQIGINFRCNTGDTIYWEFETFFRLLIPLAIDMKKVPKFGTLEAQNYRKSYLKRYMINKEYDFFLFK